MVELKFDPKFKEIPGYHEDRKADGDDSGIYNFGLGEVRWTIENDKAFPGSRLSPEIIRAEYSHLLDELELN